MKLALLKTAPAPETISTDVVEQMIEFWSERMYSLTVDLTCAQYIGDTVAAIKVEAERGIIHEFVNELLRLACGNHEFQRGELKNGTEEDGDQRTTSRSHRRLKGCP